MANSPAETDRDGSANYQQAKNVFLLQGGCSACSGKSWRSGQPGGQIGNGRHAYLGLGSPQEEGRGRASLLSRLQMTGGV